MYNDRIRDIVSHLYTHISVEIDLITQKKHRDFHLFIYRSSVALCSLFSALESEAAVVSLLLLHAEFPLLRNFHIVVLQPEKIFAVTPI